MDRLAFNRLRRDEGMLRELRVIAWLQEHAVGQRPDVLVGIGDDAAVLGGGPSPLLVTTDMILEGTHFLASTPLELVGRKAVAVNLSDIAAMAGEPVAAFMSVAFPRRLPDRALERFFEGALNLCQEFGCVLAGGDTNGTNGPLTVSVTLVGRSGPAGPVLRSGAEPGDVVFVTGALGGSLKGRHLTFVPRVREALFLAETGPPKALIDLSDGLALDSYRIAWASKCQLVLDAEAIPVAAEVGEGEMRERLKHALYDGEDFELLGCMAREAWTRVRELWSFDVPLREVGRVRPGEPGVFIRWPGGEESPLEPAGFDHFAGNDGGHNEAPT